MEKREPRGLRRLDTYSVGDHVLCDGIPSFEEGQYHGAKNYHGGIRQGLSQLHFSSAAFRMAMVAGWQAGHQKVVHVHKE
jgi:hypothetical protein